MSMPEAADRVGHKQDRGKEGPLWSAPEWKKVAVRLLKCNARSPTFACLCIFLSSLNLDVTVNISNKQFLDEMQDLPDTVTE